MDKIKIDLPLSKETPGTVVYAVKKIAEVPVGQIYIRKKFLEKTEDGNWPPMVSVTVEVLDS